MNKILPVFLSIVIAWVCIRCIPQKEILPTYGSKQFIYYTSGSSFSPLYSISTVTIDGSMVAPVSSFSSSNCTSSNSAKLTTGTHSYEAYSTDKSMRWTGTFEVLRNSCEYVYLYESEGIPTGIISTSTGSNIITDATGLQVYLTWTVSPNSSIPTNFANFDMGISTSLSGSYTNYDYSANSSSFETCQIYSSSSNSNFYINIAPSFINSSYTATCSLRFSGLNNSANSYILPINRIYSFSSSSSYSAVVRVQRSGNTFTITKYP